MEQTGMRPKTAKPASKTSVRIWRPIMEKLNEKLEAACLRRDVYFSRLIGREVEHLDTEVPAPNSKASYDHVLACLDQLDRKLVTLTLPPELVERVNRVCDQKMIVRDAFFNRLFLILAASPRAIDSLFFGSNSWREDLWKGFPDSYDRDFLDTLSNPLAPTTDPFWAIRGMLEEYATIYGPELDPLDRPMLSDTIYRSYFRKPLNGKDLTGMSCYFPDWRVPTTEEGKKVAELDAMFDEGPL